MVALKSGKNAGSETLLLGQAGVWAVSIQLILRGMVPSFPSVDRGFDIILDTGLRLQVKTGILRSYSKGRYLGYCFDCRGKKWNPELKQVRPSGHKDYARRADFYVLWGVDENRFWIMPTAEVKGNIWFPKRDMLALTSQPGRATHHRDKGLERLRRTEERWDLLDTNHVTAELIESAIPAKESI